jgi:hypothetical protein
MATEALARQFQRLYGKENLGKEILPEKVFACAERPVKRKRISIDYQLAENEGGSLDNAFDILFEETLRQNSDLTTNDN